MLAATAITGASSNCYYRSKSDTGISDRTLANFLPLDAIKYSTCDRGINGRNDSKMFF